jgi:hypothetical protein
MGERMSSDDEERIGKMMLDLIPHYVLDDRKIVHRATSFRQYMTEMEKHRVVAQETVAPNVEVSTVFLGMDAAFAFRKAAPLVFETMIFGGPLDRSCWRYATYADAVAGHDDALRAARQASGYDKLPKLRGKPSP